MKIFEYHIRNKVNWDGSTLKHDPWTQITQNNFELFFVLVNQMQKNGTFKQSVFNNKDVIPIKHDESDENIEKWLFLLHENELEMFDEDEDEERQKKCEGMKALSEFMDWVHCKDIDCLLTDIYRIDVAHFELWQICNGNNKFEDYDWNDESLDILKNAHWIYFVFECKSNNHLFTMNAEWFGY